jgi:hypothetical protein
MSQPHLQTLLTSGELKADEASDDEVSQWWQKAVRAYSDGKHSTVSPDGSRVRLDERSSGIARVRNTAVDTDRYVPL